MLYFLPEIILVILINVILIIGVFCKKFLIKRNIEILKRLYIFSFLVLICIIGLLLNSLCDGWLWSVEFYSGLMVISFYTQLVKLIITLFLCAIILVFFNYLQRQYLFTIEYLILLLLSLVAMFGLVSANDLIVIYMLLELQGLSFYVLAALNTSVLKSAEAGLKYFLIGSIASIVYLSGVAFAYIALGTTNLEDIELILFYGSSMNFLYIGFMLIFIGFFFKIAAAPFHVWIADVYEGSLLSVTAFFAILPKIVIIALIIKLLFLFNFLINFNFGLYVVLFISLLSLGIGSFSALYQDNVRRLIAYSAVGHVGFILFSFVSGTVFSIVMSLLYMIVYAVLSINFFAIISVTYNDKEIETIGDFIGTLRNNSVLSFITIMNLFSLAGIPPLSGFYGKVLILLSSIEAGLLIWVIFITLLSIMSAFYYLRIVKIAIYENKEVYFYQGNISKGLANIISFTFLLNVYFMLFFNDLVKLILYSLV